MTAREIYSQIFEKNAQFAPSFNVFQNAFMQIKKKLLPHLDKHNLFEIFEWEICSIYFILKLKVYFIYKATGFVQIIVTVPYEKKEKNESEPKNTKNPDPKFDIVILCFTEYSANILKGALWWCVDGTFKFFPKGFYQQFEIMARNDFTQGYEVCVVIYMTRKTQKLYIHAFSELSSWFLNRDGKIDFKVETIMTDFESASINALKKVFKPRVIEGCFFHAVNRWSKKAIKNGIFEYNIFNLIYLVF